MLVFRKILHTHYMNDPFAKVSVFILHYFMLASLFFDKRYDRSVRREEREKPYTPIITTYNHVGNHN